MIISLFSRFCSQYQGSTQKIPYMMTCTYDFRWRHIYVKSSIMSGSRILDRQGAIISFPRNFTKKPFFSKVRLVYETVRSNISNNLIKSKYLCINALELFGLWWTVPSVRSAIVWFLTLFWNECKNNKGLYQLINKLTIESVHVIIEWSKVIPYFFAVSSMWFLEDQ